ncbi:MAG: hypothetical protein KF813_09080 [Trueperaceae bacterium]|nr:hypothetical protein [Trueperaceae bacterium]
MYTGILDLHNVVRWAVLVLGVVAVFGAWAGVFAGGRFSEGQAKIGRWFSIAFDVQVLLGLVLYFGLSPLTRAAFQDFGAAMRDSTLRFYAIEHALMMIVAAVLVHIGLSRSKKSGKAMPAAILYTVAAVLVGVAIPWGARLFPGL